MTKRLTPAFIGIGVPYAGLGQVATWLSEHPAVADRVPALNFFNTIHYEKKGYAWYEEQIKLLKSNKDLLVGECTPGYLSHPEVPSRLAEDCPDTKLFCIVRHPLVRALAAYEAAKSIDIHASKMSAAEYLAHNTTIQEQSNYAQQLARYLAYYSPVDCKVIIYEELFQSPLTVIQDLYEYLEIDKNVIPKGLKQFAPPPDPPKNPGIIKRTKMRIHSLYKKMTERPAKPVFMPDPVLSAYLSSEEINIFMELYKQPVEHLSHLLSRDMSVVWDLGAK